ncbi:unnamed protein product [Caenorhabditis brenneri]
MKSVKWYLVNLHIWIMIFDYTYGLLTIPYLLLPHLAGIPLGILQFFGVPNQYQVLTLVLFLTYVVNSIVAVFENRFHVVCIYPGKQSWKYWRRWWLAAHYVGAFLIVASLLLVTPDQESARRHVIEDLPCLRHYISETRLFVFSENVFYVAFVFAFYATVSISESFLFSGFLISYTLRQLKSRRMSRKTFNIQRKFLMALVIQMEVPLTMLLLPFLYGWLSILTGYHNQVLINIALTIGSMHGFCSTLVMLFVQHPYRETMFNLVLETKIMRMFEKDLNTQRPILH